MCPFYKSGRDYEPDFSSRKKTFYSHVYYDTLNGYLISNRTDGDRAMTEFDVLLNPAKESILTLDILNIGPLEKQLWTPQASGISIRPELVEELKALWQDFLQTLNKATWVS